MNYLLSFLALTLFSPGLLLAQYPPYLQTDIVDNSTGTDRTQYSAASSLSDSDSSPYTDLATTTVYGAASSSSFSNVPHAYSTNATSQGQWIDVYTNISPNATKARVTAQFSGNNQGDQDHGSFGNVGVVINGASYSMDSLDPDTAIPSTITVDVPLGGPTLSLSFRVGAGSFCYYGFVGGGSDPGAPSWANATGTLRSLGFVLLDDNDQPVDYTCDSRTGSASAVTYPAGSTYNSFTLTNSAPDRLGSTMQLLDGTASTDTQVVATFGAPPSQPEIKPVSDVVNLQGTNIDPVVIQINYDASIATSDFGSLAYLELAWFQNSTGTWKNAILGNSGTTMPTYFNRAYNPATDFHLGYFGNDTVNHLVWAVVNHNSEFVVTQPPAALKIASLNHSAAHTIHLNCQGEPARVNRIEASPDLNPANFTTIASVAADGSGNFAFDDSNATGSRKFYRVAYP